MTGQKIQAEFALVKLKNAEKNAWLLIKHKDKYAKAIDVTKKDKSVVSGLSIEKVEKTSSNTWGSDQKSKIKNQKSKKATASGAVVKKKIKPEGEKSSFPSTISP